MDNGDPDSSGTDADLPSYQNRGVRGGYITGNGRTIVSAPPYPRVQNDMESQIHRLEQDAYSAVLRAFKAQSDAITWEKESLITELRKELRLSDEEHRELLNKVNKDHTIKRIREWRQEGGILSGLLNNIQLVNDLAPSPNMSAPRKRQKMSRSISLGASSPAHSQPSPIAGEVGVAAGAKGKKLKSDQRLSGISGVLAATEPTAYDSLIGRRVMTRWHQDNNFYEAVIADYSANEGLHFLGYNVNTENATWEWVNLKKISPEDIKWDGEDPGRRGFLKNQFNKDFTPSQNGLKNEGSNGIEIFHTETLIKEVELVYDASQPDPMEMLKAKKLLKEHEQALIDAIERIGTAFDCGSEEGGDQISQGQFMDQERSWRNQAPTEPARS